MNLVRASGVVRDAARRRRAVRVADMPTFTTGLPAFMSSMSQSSVVSVSTAAVTVVGISVYTIFKASSTRARAEHAWRCRLSGVRTLCVARLAARAPDALPSARSAARTAARSGRQGALDDHAGVEAGHHQVSRCAGAGPDQQPLRRALLCSNGGVLLLHSTGMSRTRDLRAPSGSPRSAASRHRTAAPV